MSDQHDADRWRELADLLGLPPDENKSAKPSPQTHKEEKAAPPHIPEHDRYTAEPVAEDSFEPPTYEEVEVVETVFAVEEIGTPMSSESVEAEPGAEEGESTERRRRGRRRGRRGQKNDGPDRHDREPRDAAPGPKNHGEPAREPIDESRADESRADDEHNEREHGDRAEAGDREERIGRDERGRRERGPRHEHAEAQRPDFEDDEVLEGEHSEREPVAEDADDEEIDKLTDWNVPSWNDLISSLYRPDR